MGFDGNGRVATAPGQGEVAAEISREIVKLNAKLHGRGPVKARTLIQRELALCVLESVFTPAERTLLDAGRAEEVLASRSAIAHVAQEQLCEVVEQATGRKVRGFTSGVDPERDVATNVFLFD